MNFSDTICDTFDAQRIVGKLRPSRTSRRMTDRTSPRGWVIHVTKPRLGRPPSVDFYAVAIADAGDPVEAVQQVCLPGLDTVIETIAELPTGTNLRAGEILLR